MSARWQCPFCGEKSDRDTNKAPICGGSGRNLHRATYMWRRQGDHFATGYYARPLPPLDGDKEGTA